MLHLEVYGDVDVYAVYAACFPTCALHSLPPPVDLTASPSVCMLRMQPTCCGLYAVLVLNTQDLAHQIKDLLTQAAHSGPSGPGPAPTQSSDEAARQKKLLQDFYTILQVGGAGACDCRGAGAGAIVGCQTLKHVRQTSTGQPLFVRMRNMNRAMCPVRDMHTYPATGSVSYGNRFLLLSGSDAVFMPS